MMEYKSVGALHDGSNKKNEATEVTSPKNDVKDVSRSVHDSSETSTQAKTVDMKGAETTAHNVPSYENTHGEVNMEASIIADDVIRAGGFGARDDISSFLPVASDSTDFEATIRDARDYEEAQGEICRPGLGWTDTTQRD